MSLSRSADKSGVSDHSPASLKFPVEKHPFNGAMCLVPSKVLAAVPDYSDDTY